MIKVCDDECRLVLNSPSAKRHGLTKGILAVNTCSGEVPKEWAAERIIGAGVNGG
jgi:hypothetical protein